MRDISQKGRTEDIGVVLLAKTIDTAITVKEL